MLSWIHQIEALQQETLKTLAIAPFNKIRMCIFPKSMPYNNNDPDCYPFFKKEDGSWDVTQPDPVFWNKLDLRLRQLMDLGIEADLIVFHPYDRWGFAKLSQEDSLTYLSYCIARLASYRNVWWSLANEYEMVYAKSMDDWDAYGEMLADQDIYHHLISVHNIITPYPKRPWMTHASIQSKAIDKVFVWKQMYQLPVIVDECGYEGDIAFDWGNLTAYVMVHSFWQVVCRGGFCTHGETFHRDDEVLWWAKGGKLYGESVKRIAFMKDFLYSLPGNWYTRNMAAHNPNENATDEDEMSDEKAFYNTLMRAPADARLDVILSLSPMTIFGEGYELQFLGRSRPIYKEYQLDTNKKYRVEVIDIWEMSRTLAAEGIFGQVKVRLPGKPGLAVLVTEM